MFLSNMIRRLQDCFTEGSGELVFLVARNQMPFEAAEDKDIWSLSGPVDIGERPGELWLSRKKLVDIESALEQLPEKTSTTTQCGQDLFLLIREEEQTTAAKVGRARNAEDKDIWSLTKPLGSVRFDFPRLRSRGPNGSVVTSVAKVEEAPRHEGLAS